MKLKMPKLGDEQVRIEPTGWGKTWRVRAFRFIPIGGDQTRGFWQEIATAVVSNERGAGDTARAWQRPTNA